MERLTEKGFDFTADFVASNLQSFPIAEALKKLQMIENAEAEGRLVVLPCKVGDNIYVLEPKASSGIEKTRLRRIMIKGRNSMRIFADCVHDDWGSATWDFPMADLGVKWFLTHEDAKAALKTKED